MQKNSPRNRIEIENRRSKLEVETCVEVKDAGSVLGGESVGIFNVQNEIAVEDEFQGGSGGEVDGVSGSGGDEL